MKLLCVDDEAVQRQKMESMVTALGHQVQSNNGAKAMALPADEALSFDAAVVDQNLENDITGEEVGRSLRSKNPRIFLIMLTAYSSLERGLEAVTSAGFDYYITKGTKQESELLIKELARAEKESGYRRTNEAVMRLLVNKVIPAGIRLSGEHPLFLDAVRSAMAVAERNTTVLLLGESGTGKELFAKLVHACSERSLQPLVSINCAAIPENMLESEIFGHEKGAFTGALKQKNGRVEDARNGTLFLDEIGEMSKPLQAKLLRFLQDGSFTRVGGNQELKVNVRLVSATNANLRTKIADGSFREDLFYRLAVFPISLPPLRERQSDIPILANKFREEFAGPSGGKPRTFAREALDALCSHNWPGNVRELRNQIERATILAKDKRSINSHHLKFTTAELGSTPSKQISNPSASTPASAERLRMDYWESEIEKKLNNLEDKFQEALKKIKAGKKMRQKDLANELGRSHVTVSNFFNKGKRWNKIPGFVRLMLIRTLATKFPQNWPGMRGTQSPLSKHFQP